MRRLLFIALLISLILACEHETIRMDEYGVHGIDVSHHQSRIWWDSVALNPLRFAFVKATEGATHFDSLYCYNWEEMKRVGLKRGAYHFFRPTTPAEQQARNFLEWVEMQQGDMPPVLDVEVLDGVSKLALIREMRTWLHIVELHYNIRPIIYTNLKFYNKYLAGHFEDYPLWIARYSYREPRLASGRDWQFWQYGNRGRIAGIEGFVDFNVFFGDPVQLESLCMSSSAILSRN